MLWTLNHRDSQQWLALEIGNLSKINWLIVKNDGPFKDRLNRYDYATRYEKKLPGFTNATKEVIFCIIEKADCKIIVSCLLINWLSRTLRFSIRVAIC
jgi:hypothetical protein